MSGRNAPKPLILDVDGTLLKTDLLFEAFWNGLGRDPVKTLGALAYLGNPARLKSALAGVSALRFDLMPIRREVLAMAQRAQAEGCDVILASASNETHVQALAKVHDLSPRVFASTSTENLKGIRKADALVDAFGSRGFHYAGNGKHDRPVWDAADAAIVVGRVPGAAAALRTARHPVTELPGGWSISQLWRAIRPRQWVKNVLLLLPMIAAHAFDLRTLGLVLLAILSFSAAASAIYIVNDLLDLEADRLHPTKRRRPFASGRVPIPVGMIAALALAILALGVGAFLSFGYFAIVTLYILLSLAYSLKLKRMRWVDVFTLGGLYTLRIVAGAVASGVGASVYMLVFIFPVFLTLGCVKRLTELAKVEGNARLPGRGYGRPDRGDLLNMAGLGCAGAVVIFALYSMSDQARELYQTQWILWLAIPPIAIWLIRMVALGYHGRMSYDPVVFALRDSKGLGLLALTLSLMFWSAGLWEEWFG